MRPRKSLPLMGWLSRPISIAAWLSFDTSVNCSADRCCTLLLYTAKQPVQMIEKIL